MLYEDYLYARISEDDLGLYKGVNRQLAELDELSAARNGRVAGRWADNDISAAKGAPRPDYESLMAAVLAPNPLGVQRRILVVHTSRLWRNRQERAHGIDVLGAADLLILPKNGPELDLRTAAGRMVAGMLGEVDTGESETKGERVFDAARERAHEGRSNGAVSYGWSRVYEYDKQGKIVGFEDVEDLAQADIVREIVKRLLAGDTLLAITKDLNRRGVPAPRAGTRRAHRAKGQTPDGQRWGKTSVKKLAMRPANIGMRIYHRGRPDEVLLPAAWPKIVDPDDHARVMELLTDPARRTQKGGARRHLLTWGIGECGVCGAHLRTSWKGGNTKGKNGRPYGQKALLYLCEAKGCVGRNEEFVDLKVDEWMIALLQQPQVLGLLDGDANEQAQLLKTADTIRAKLAEAATDFADGLLDREQIRIITGKLRPQLEQAEAAARAYRQSPHLELVVGSVGDRAREKWESYTVQQKRAIMQAFRVRVIILPTRRGPGFDPESVQVVAGDPA